MEIVIADKLENLLGVLGGLRQKGFWVFIELSKSCSVDWKPESVLMSGLSGSSVAAVWQQGFPL